MEPQNPAYRPRVEALFGGAAFMRFLGVQFVDCGPGWCETSLVLRAEHMQQDGFVHAGVMGAMADHTAGAAAGTLMAEDEIVLTVEYKLHLLRPAQGDVLRCRAQVLRPGRRISIVEAEVWTRRGAGQPESLVAKLIATMTLVRNT